MHRANEQLTRRRRRATTYDDDDEPLEPELVITDDDDKRRQRRATIKTTTSDGASRNNKNISSIVSEASRIDRPAFFFFLRLLFLLRLLLKRLKVEERKDGRRVKVKAILTRARSRSLFDVARELPKKCARAPMTTRPKMAPLLDSSPQAARALLSSPPLLLLLVVRAHSCERCRRAHLDVDANKTSSPLEGLRQRAHTKPFLASAVCVDFV